MMDDLITKIDKNQARIWKILVIPLVLFSIFLLTYIGLEKWERYNNRPFHDVQLLSVSAVPEGFRIKATFYKNNGEFKRLAPIVYDVGLPHRAGVITHDQPAGIPTSRLAGDAYFDITIVTEIKHPERIVIKVEHALSFPDANTVFETNTFLDIDQRTLRSFLYEK